MIVDSHTHCSLGGLQTLERVMDVCRVDHSLVLSWPGEGRALLDEVARYDLGGRVSVGLSPSLGLVGTGGWDSELAHIAELLPEAAALKIYKTASLGQQILGTGKPLTLNSPLLDSLWELAAEHDTPVVIHWGDPADFWKSTPRLRRRQLEHRPEWRYFNNPRVPDRALILQMRDKLIADNPRVTFVGAHFGGFPADPAELQGIITRIDVDTSAALEEILTYDRSLVMDQFTRFESRILWGSDVMVPKQDGDDGATVRVLAKFVLDSLKMVTSAEMMSAPDAFELDARFAGLGLEGPRRSKLLADNAIRRFRLPVPSPTSET